jgi:uncharacterized protein
MSQRTEPQLNAARRREEDQMAHPNEERAREGLAAFQSGDLDALRDKFFATDIRYHVPGKSPIAGDYEGVDQVLGLFAKLFELTNGTFRIEVHDVLADDEHVVELLTARGERNGKHLEDNGVLTAHMTNGKLSEVWIQQTDLYAVDEFLS